MSILTIPNRRQLLGEYIDPTSRYAWPMYDEDFAPDNMSGVDLAAPALLSYPLPVQCLREMGRTRVVTPYETLVKRMRAFLATPGPTTFIDLTTSQVSTLATRTRGAPVQGFRWSAFIQCLDAVQNTCPTLTSVAVTKILHRKRPDLVPLNDDRLRTFYGADNRYAPLFKAIWDDLQRPQVQRELRTWIDGVQTPSGRPLTMLRALDIIVWMHQGRAGGAAGIGPGGGRPAAAPPAGGAEGAPVEPSVATEVDLPPPDMT